MCIRGKSEEKGQLSSNICMAVTKKKYSSFSSEFHGAEPEAIRTSYKKANSG